MNLYNTKTFTYGEKEAISVYYGCEPVTIHYCGYCGKKAHMKDIGSTRNHRYEEDIHYFCDCKQAQEEQDLKKKQMDLKNQLYQVEKALEKQGNLPDTPAVEQVKYRCEWQALQRKYPNALEEAGATSYPKN